MEQPKSNLQIIQERIKASKEAELKRKKEVEALETPDDSNMMHKKLAAFEVIKLNMKLIRLSISSIIFIFLTSMVYSFTGAPKYFDYIKIGLLGVALFYNGYMLFTSNSSKKYLEEKYFLK